MTRNLEVELHSRCPLERVAGLLAEDPRAVLTEPGTVVRNDHRYPKVLVTEGAAGAGASHEVLLELGPPTATDDDARWPLRWEPTAHRRVLPSFDGSLVATRIPTGTRLSLSGTYDPPFGLVGELADSVAMHRVADASAAHLLRDIVRRAERRIDHDNTVGGVRPATYPPDLRSVDS